NGGPNGIIARKNVLFLNCHCSCIKQMVNPAAESDEDFVVWTNDNGDYFLDHNYVPDAPRSWVCNDLAVGPFNYHLAPDDNLFSLAAYGEGTTSFGLLAPDGDGIGYFSYANDTGGWKWFNIVVDSGCAFDGIYCDNQEIIPYELRLTQNNPGIFFIAHDSIKGVISNQIGVKDSAPAAFTVAQNTPNPFNPATTISFTLAKSGKTTVEVYNSAGQKVATILNANLSAGSHSVTWNTAGHSAGVYFYTVRNGEFSRTMKMTLLK
ncbi:MAG: T9SS type A sorting domain-containing protein, partial [Candidatus Latescibacterota bacterium]